MQDKTGLVLDPTGSGFRVNDTNGRFRGFIKQDRETTGSHPKFLGWYFQTPEGNKGRTFTTKVAAEYDALAFIAEMEKLERPR